MRQDHDTHRDWTYSTGEEPLWTPPRMPRHQRLAGRGRLYGLAAALGIGFLLIVGGGTFMLMSSADDPNALGEDELNELIAARASLSGSTDTATSTFEPSPRPASTTLSVFSDPPEATVLIDYDSIGVTPLLGHALSSGVYILSVTDGPDVRLDTVIVVRERGQQRPISIELDRREQATTASDARLATGNDEPDRSNAERQPAPERSEPEVVVERRTESTRSADPATESPPEERRVTPRQDESARYGMLSISSAPSGAEVRLDGETVGVTPLRLQRVAIGRHDVSLHLDDHQTASAVVDVRPRQSASVHEVLTLGSGQVTIRVKPWGTIFINGELHGRDLDVQYVTQLPAGQHRITVFHPAFQEYERVVDVRPNSSQQITIDLTAAAAATSDRQ